MRERLRAHIDLARQLEGELRERPGIEIVAPVPFSVVVFRFAPEGLSPEEQDALNRGILERVNEDGRFFISHAVVRGRYVLRAAFGSLRTEPRHVPAFVGVLEEAAAEIRKTLA